MRLSKDELLALFPGYKPTLYFSSMNGDFIYPVFTDYDRIELEERLMSAEEVEKIAQKRERDKIKEHNKENEQGVLFL